jgi:hypothetical protein
MIGLASYGLLLAMLTVATLRAPIVALAGILCLFGLEQWGQNSSALLVQHQVATNLAVGGLVLLGLSIRAMRSECLVCRWTPAATLILALYGYAFCTLAWTPDVGVGLEQWRKHTPYLLTIVVAAPLLAGKLDDVRLAFSWTVFVAAVLCALALTLGTWGARGLLVYGSPLENETNSLAIASMGGTMLVAATLSLQQGQPLLKKALFLIAIPLALAVILRSGSRGQLIAAGLAVLVAWPLAYPQKHLGSLAMWMGGVALVAVVGWWAADYVTVDAARWSAEKTSGDVEGRLHGALTLLSLAMAHPLTFLFGLGNSSAFHYIGAYPHITPLEELAEEGLIGTGIYAGILYVTGRSILRLLRVAARSSDTNMRAGVAVLGALFLFEFVLTMKQGSLLSCYFAFVYSMLLSRVEALTAQTVQQAQIPAVAATFTPFPNLLR